MTSYEEIRRTFDDVRLRRGWSKAELLRNVADEPELERAKFYKFLAGQSVAQADALLRWMTRLGFGIFAPDDASAAAPRPTGDEVARLKAQLEAEKEKTAMLEGLLRDALIAGRGVANGAAEEPAAPDQLKRKAG
mgnify:CR=1 FL=1